jgi:hypothetical protein
MYVASQIVPAGYLYISLGINVFLALCCSLMLYKTTQFMSRERFDLHTYIEEYVNNYYGHLLNKEPKKSYFTRSKLLDAIEYLYIRVTIAAIKPINALKSGIESVGNDIPHVLILLNLLAHYPPTLEMAGDSVMYAINQEKVDTGMSQRENQLAYLLEQWPKHVRSKLERKPDSTHRTLGLEALDNDDAARTTLTELYKHMLTTT